MTKYIGPKTDGANVATQSDVGGSSLSDATPDAMTPDQAGTAGTVNSAARADHAHEILCAAAGAILPDDVAAEGTATSFARSDHTHAITAAAPSANLTASTTNTEGTATSFARSDHSHAITTGAAGTITGTNAEGTSASLARADHNHAIATAAPGTILPDAVAATGSAGSFSRSDHTHAITAAAPSSNLTASTTNTEGTASSFARSDHSHAITTGAPGTILPDDAAAAGSAASFSRSDHTHAITAAAPSANLTATTTNTEGSSTSFARADHSHKISTGSAGTITGVSNTEGTSTSFARADHTHAISLPRCKATRSTDQSINNNTNTVVDFPDEDIDTDGFHSTVSNTSRLTIPSGLGGDYLITGFAIFASNATGNRLLAILKNGVSSPPEAPLATQLPTSNPTRITVSGLLYNLVANDYLELRVFQNSGGSLNIENASLAIVRIG